jgi:hypothetical protein
MRAPRRAPRLAALGAALALGAAACGGGSSDSPDRPDTLTPQAALAAAVQNAEEMTSSRFVLSTKTTGAGASFQMSGEGAYDYAASEGEMRFTLPGTGGELRQRVVGDSLYMQLPNEPDVFYELKLSDLVDTSLAATADPTAGLQSLQEASDDVVEVGREEQRGAQTTHYRGTLPMEKALEVFEGRMQEMVEQFLDTTELEDVPFDAWIDDEGRLRRMDQTVTFETSMLQGQPMTVETRLELYDFGVEVDVAAPPANSVRDGTPLLDAMSGSMQSS